MASLKDKQFSEQGELASKKTRQEEESQSALQSSTPQSGTFKVYKLSDVNKKGSYHMEGVDDVWDPEAKKMQRVRLLRGFPSIYVKDQKDLDENYIKSNRRSLIFRQRILRVADYDTTAIEFLNICNSNVDNDNRKGTRRLTFFEWNPLRQAELERKFLLR